MPKIVSININENGGVPKYPVKHAYVGRYRVTGDKQNDLKHHGGENRAVCLYSIDLITDLKNEGHPIFAGSTGENITIQGLDWSSLKKGDVIEMGEVKIELTKPTPPCKTIAKSFINEKFVRISENKYPGWSRWYAKVLQEGTVNLNDNVSLNM
ncbi:MOSC domain-containing protein [Crocinitomicaceae bacterium]|jgi:MOSC domain-containing protein YiiM|nr:MOSC domain-containing protein [Flavobacteriales bacterium]MDA7762100.1 MOSC domain-containing protein [Crocinitomicaceae bacterium]